MSEAEARARPIYWSIAVTLMLLSVMSYLDRQILALLVPDLHRELGLTDLQIGTLIGPAFVFTYLLALIVAAFIIDRFDKITIIVCGTIFWALMTFASAFARSYGELIVLRAGLAVGEAMLGPAATALIGEMFRDDRRRRMTASAFFLMGSTIGASGSAAFGAFAIQLVATINVTLPRVGHASDWRLALIAVSLPSVLLALLLLALGRRRVGPREVRTDDMEDGAETLADHLRAQGSRYLLLFVGVNVMVMAQVGVFVWGPSYLMRNFALKQVDAGYTLGLVALAGGVSGTLASTAVIRRWAADGTARAFTRLAFVVGAAAMLLIAGAMIAPSLRAGMALLLIALAFAGVLVTIPMQYLQSVAPPHLKGRIAVGMYLILYCLTSGVGPLVPPAIAAHLAPGADQLGRAMAICAIASLAVSGTLLTILYRAAPRFETVRA